MTPPARAAARWAGQLNGDPLPWLLDADAPAIRHRALRELLDLPQDSVEVVEAGRAAMHSDPIASILAAQQPDGWWVKPGGGYSPLRACRVLKMIEDARAAAGATPAGSRFVSRRTAEARSA